MPMPKANLFNHIHALIGAARYDITPPESIYFKNWGAATMEQASRIHRPFTVTALTLRVEASTQPLILISLDAGWWQSGADERFVRDSVIQALELDEKNLIINMSHTHAGPSLASDNHSKPGGEFIRPYLEHIRDQIIAASRKALAEEQDAVLTWTTGCCDLAVNRNLKDPAGTRYLTGFNPSGTADTTLLVGRVSNTNGDIVATLVNYACHPTTLAWENTELSPDYIGAMRKTVEAATSGAPCLFLLGACGELAPAFQYVGDVSVADKHGRKLGLAVCATLEGFLEPGHDLVYEGAVESGAPLAVWRSKSAPKTLPTVKAIQIKIPLTIKAEYPPLQTILHSLESAEENYLKERLTRQARLRRTLGDGETFDFPVWLWAIGNTVMVGYPGEAYSWLQKELRAAAPNKHVIVMNLSNGTTGYLPPAKLYGQDIYEVWQTPFERGSLEKLRDACVDAMQSLT